MTWFAAFLPHGAKVHATTTPPDNRTGIMVRERVTLCGRRCYSGGPAEPWESVRISRTSHTCARCQARIDATPKGTL